MSSSSSSSSLCTHGSCINDFVFWRNSSKAAALAAMILIRYNYGFPNLQKKREFLQPSQRNNPPSVPFQDSVIWRRRCSKTRAANCLTPARMGVVVNWIFFLCTGLDIRMRVVPENSWTSVFLELTWAWATALWTAPALATHSMIPAYMHARARTHTHTLSLPPSLPPSPCVLCLIQLPERKKTEKKKQPKSNFPMETAPIHKNWWRLGIEMKSFNKENLDEEERLKTSYEKTWRRRSASNLGVGTV
jgi:hypothetical protein